MNNPDFTFAPTDPPAASGAPPVRRDPPPPTPRPVRVRRGFPLLSLLLFIVLAAVVYVVWADPPGIRGGLAQAGAGQLAASVGLPAEGAVDTLRERVDGLAAQLAGIAAPKLPPDNSAQVQALADRLDRLEKTVAQLQTQLAAAPAAPPQGAADQGDLAKQVADLSARVDALANRPASAAAPDTGASSQQMADLAQAQQKLDQAVAAQSARIDQLQASDKGALDNLSNAVNQEQAQQKDTLAALDSRVGTLEKGAGKVLGTAKSAEKMTRVQAAEVALLAGQKLGEIPGAPPALARFADKAPPTDAELRESFPAYADKARAVSQPELANKSFLERSWLRLQQSVTVRQGDDVLVGDPAAGVLADAAARVQNDDLPGAIKVLQHLKGPAAGAVKPWVDDASALVEARAALAAMAAQH